MVAKCLVPLVRVLIAVTIGVGVGVVMHHPQRSAQAVETVTYGPFQPDVLREADLAKVSRSMIRLPLHKVVKHRRRVVSTTSSAPVMVPGTTIWDRLAECESGGNWADTEGFYEGGLQFANSTWLDNGGGRFAQHAYDATRAEQIEIAERVEAESGWGQWPVCSAELGLR